MKIDHQEKITTLLKQTHPRLSTTHQLEFKNVFGAVGGYVNGKIFISGGQFGVALRLSPETLDSLFQTRRAGPLKYFSKGHVKKEYGVLSKQVLENNRYLRKLVSESISYVLGV